MYSSWNYVYVSVVASKIKTTLIIVTSVTSIHMSLIILPYFQDGMCHVILNKKLYYYYYYFGVLPLKTVRVVTSMLFKRMTINKSMKVGKLSKPAQNKLLQTYPKNNYK